MADDNETELLTLPPDEVEETTLPVAEPDKPAPEQKDAVTELREQLEAHKRAAQEEATARRAAEERAARFEREATDNRGHVQTGQIAQLSAAIDNVTTQVSVTKREYSAALQAGDFDRAADLQEKLAEQVSQVGQLRIGKANLERAAKAPAPERSAGGQRANTNTLSPASAAWVRAHPDAVKDDAALARLMEAHNAAVAEGYAVDHPRYFAHIESELGYGQPIDLEAAPAPVPRRAPVAAAPVSRQAPMNGNQHTPNRTVKITQAQRDMNKAMGVSDAEWAKGLLEAEKRARIEAMEKNSA